MAAVNLAELSDEELAALAGQGQSEPVDALLDRYKDMVNSRAGLYFMLGAEQSDVVQEGMIGLFKAVRMYDPSKGASFIATRLASTRATRALCSFSSRQIVPLTSR